MASNVDELVSRVRRRLRFSVILREVFRYTTAFALGAFAVSALSKFIHPLGLWQLHAGVICLGIVAGFVAGLRVRVTPFEAAMVADLRGNTGEKLTAYLDSLDRPSPFDDLIESNAFAAAKALDYHEILRYRIPRTARFLFVLLILVAAMFFVPKFPYPSQVRRERNRLELSEAVKMLEKASKSLEELKSTDPEIEKLQSRLDELRAKLRRGDIDRKRALAEITKVSEELQKRLRETYMKKALVEKAANELAGKEETSRLADAMKDRDKGKISEETSKVRKKLEELMNEMRSGDAERREKAREKMEDLMNALKAAGEKAGGEKGKGMSRELAEALDALDKIALDKFEGDVPEWMLDEFEKSLSKDLLKMLEGQELSKEDLEKMMKALEEMAMAEAEALCGQSGEG